MAIFQRAAGGHVAERVQTQPGSDEEAKYERLADDPASDWRQVDVEAAPAKPKRSTRTAGKE